MPSILRELNHKQQEAIKYISGPLLVIAGAGSGKTRVITNKIAYLIQECGYNPKNITAITFTNKAAHEMLERTSKIFKNINTKGLTITTFHSLGLKILKQESCHLGFKPTFSILDSYDSYKIISDIVKTSDKTFVKSVQNQISTWKNNLYTPEYALLNAKDILNAEIANFYQIYQDTLKVYQSVDFDDLIKLPVELFTQNLTVLFKWQQKIRYLLIDEYQDTNECQYNLIKLLTSRDKLFTAVGDDDQSIYTWRGANANNINNLKQDFENLEIIKLEQNYRSTTTILNAANNVIKNNIKLFDKQLWSDLGHGEAINVISCKNESQEAENIIRKIMLHHLQNNSNYSDYVILYRGNHQSRILEPILRSYQLPYTISGSQSLFEKTEIKDILSYLRLLVNEEDDTAFIRAVTTPKRSIGQATLEKLATYSNNRNISMFAAIFEEGFISSCTQNQIEILNSFGNIINNMQFAINKNQTEDLLNGLIHQIKYEEYLYEIESNSKAAEKRFANVLGLIDWINKKTAVDNKSLPEVIQTITLISILNETQDNKELNAIKLSTLHAAKGLEYPYVYLIGCEEGILPHTESINKDSVEEERRLMYVGITRAQKELTISYCRNRKQQRELQTRERSRFIDEMGTNNIIDAEKNSHQQQASSVQIKNRLQALQELLNR